MSNTKRTKFLLTTAALLAGVSVAAAQGAGVGAGAGAHEKPEGAMSGGAQGVASQHQGAGMTQGRAADRSTESGSVHQRSSALMDGRAENRNNSRESRSGSTESSHSSNEISKVHANRNKVDANRNQEDQAAGQRHSERKHPQQGDQAQRRAPDARQGSEHDRRQSENHARAKQDASPINTSHADRSKAGAQAAERQGSKEGVTTGVNGGSDAKDQTAQHGQVTTRDQSEGKTYSRTQAEGPVTKTMSGKTVNAEQQTKLQQSVLQSNKVTRVNDDSINFRIDTGVVVPERIAMVSVSTFPILVDMYPAYRQDRFFVVNDEIVVVDSRRRIVDVIPAGSRAHYSRHGTQRSVAVIDLSPDEIRVVQRALIERGLLSGEADGILGPRTREALITFQKRQGLETNGKITSKTVEQLGVSNQISATQNQTTTGHGQAAHASTGQKSQNPGQANTSEQRNQSSASDRQARQNQPSTTGQATNQRTSEQAAPTGSSELNKQPSGPSSQNNGGASAPGGQSNHPDSSRK